VTVPAQPVEAGKKGGVAGRRIRGTVSAAVVAVMSWVRRYSALLKRSAFFISLTSLAFSGISLYETVLKQPKLTIFAGCNWEYGRGPGSYDEFFVVPITIANHGARTGAVLAVELTVSRGGQTKQFSARATVENLDDKRRQLFAPLAVSGHDSATASIVFTQRRLTTPPLVHEDGRYRTRLKLVTVLDTSYGIIDRMLAPSAPQARFDIGLTGFDIAPVLAGSNASLDACPPPLHDEEPL
jgi:hypothetical protein